MGCVLSASNCRMLVGLCVVGEVGGISKCSLETRHRDDAGETDAANMYKSVCLRGV